MPPARKSRVTRVTDWFYLRMRHRAAWSSATAQPVPAERGFELLRGHKYCLLTTYRRNGEAVPTPVWFGLDGDGRLYFRSEEAAGKVRRIRATPAVRVAPCDARGRPLGSPAEGRARILEDEDEDEDEARAEAALAANYGAGRRLYERTGDLIGPPAVYVEVQAPRG